MDENPKEKLKILVVDDEKDLIDAVKHLLEERGYKVLEAHDGIAALDVAQKKHPDLILLDIVMPNMDGMGFLARLKKDESIKNIPVIMLTARDGQANRNISFEAGAYEYISKPYDSLVLLRQIRNALEKTGKLKRSNN